MVILPSISSSPFESILFRAAFSLAFFAALRISEFVAPSKIVHSNLKMSDVYLSGNSLKLYIFKSKNDQQCSGAWIHLFPIPASIICLFKCISNYLAICPINFSSFSFMRICPLLLNFGLIQFLENPF